MPSRESAAQDRPPQNAKVRPEATHLPTPHQCRQCQRHDHQRRAGDPHFRRRRPQRQDDDAEEVGGDSDDQQEGEESATRPDGLRDVVASGNVDRARDRPALREQQFVSQVQEPDVDERRASDAAGGGDDRHGPPAPGVKRPTAHDTLCDLLADQREEEGHRDLVHPERGRV